MKRTGLICAVFITTISGSWGCAIMEPGPTTELPMCSRKLSSFSIGCPSNAKLAVLSVTGVMRAKAVENCLGRVKNACDGATTCELRVGSRCTGLYRLRHLYFVNFACMKDIPAGDPKIDGFGRSATFYENTHHVISCSWPGGTPNSVVELSCGRVTNVGVSITVLNLNVSRAMDGKRCMCRGFHPGRNGQASLNMTVYYPPGTPTISTLFEFPWIVGTMQSLTCAANPGNPPDTYYTWLTIGGKLIASGAKLTFKPVSKANRSQTFICQAQNSYTLAMNSVTRSTPLTLVVQYPPTLIPNISLSQTPVDGNETVYMSCRWKGGNPKAKMRLACGRSVYMGVSEVGVSVDVGTNLNISVCTCEGLHPLKNITVSRNVSFRYFPPAALRIEGFSAGSPVPENRSLTITCAWQQHPPTPEVQLSCAGQTRTALSESSLTFLVTRDLDGKRCRCEATHLLWRTTVRVTKLVTVYYPPQISRINKSSEFPWIENSTQSLTCTATPGNPPRTVYRWVTGNDSGLATHAGATLKFRPVGRGNDGETVICQAENSFSAKLRLEVKSAPVIVKVAYPPGIPVVTKSAEFPWLANTSHVLSCKAEPGNPGTTSYQWVTGQRRVIHTGPSLIIDPVSRQNNSKKIYCQAENRFSKESSLSVLSAALYISVEYPPIIKIKGDTTAVEGKTLDLSCVARGNPKPHIKWWYQGHLLQNQSKLRLPDVNRTQAGKYICRAIGISSRYGRLVEEKAVRVRINYAPVVKVFTKNATQGEQANFTCSAKGLPEVFAFKWQQRWRGKVLREFKANVIGTGRAILTIDRVTYEDAGSYVCLVENGIPDTHSQRLQSARAEFRVKGIPIIKGKTTRRVSGEVGKNVTLASRFYSYPSPAEASWTSETEEAALPSNMQSETRPSQVPLLLHGKRVQMDGHISVLRIANVKETDFHSFQFNVTNEFGSALQKIHLNPAGPPLTPVHFALTNVSQTTMSLEWMPAFNGGYQQVFVLRYRSASGVQWETKRYSDPGKGRQVRVTVDGLKTSTGYVFQLYAENSMPSPGNRSAYVKLTARTTDKSVQVKFSASIVTWSAIGFIVGGVVAALLVFAGCFLINRVTHNPSDRSDSIYKTDSFIYENIDDTYSTPMSDFQQNNANHFADDDSLSNICAQLQPLDANSLERQIYTSLHSLQKPGAQDVSPVTCENRAR